MENCAYLMLILTEDCNNFSVVYRLGWLIRFISHSVISGFTTASAIVIGLSQIKYFLGYSVRRSSKIIPLIESVIAGIDQKAIPFFAVLVASICHGINISCYSFNYETHTIWPWHSKYMWFILLCIPCYRKSFLVVNAGSFSRSAVNHESGAKTGLSGIIMGIIIVSALLFMTPLFTDIPQCALAAIVISAVTGLVDYEEAIFLWGIDKKDFFLWAITFITTLTFGIEIGVLVGVGFSLAFVIHESANPHIGKLFPISR
ncbi:hypothetical protein PR202_gb29547 [Eleusine coracana subsp. coracana]|uniref:SLC26A/SulP transporter domain-containing protein n=1 Tax=Eleusine coracana subsp. coracana TaxID=191504 RepID=A0AAV5G067_ELECO|nr:hypothetical protein PR202_gb29547 [Eleusine coracana subsp. coracana]